MKYQPLNDVIDPEVPAEGEALFDAGQEDPDAPNDAYVIGERGNTVQAPDARPIEKAEATGPKPWVKPMAALLAIAFVALTVWNISRLAAGTPPPPQPTTFQVKQALYLGAMKIEAYRRVHGVTPEALEEAGLSNPPYAYERVSPTQYAIGFEAGGSRLDYDSSVPLQQFFGSPQEMLKMGGSR